MQAVRRHDAAVIRRTTEREARGIAPVLSNPAYQAFLVLRSTFTIAPIVMGADKFTDLLTTWTQYLAPAFPRTIGVSPELFMKGVGVIEIVAGVLVAVIPRYAAYVVAAWLGLIMVNLLLLGKYLDVAMRDLGLMLAALALARIAQSVHEWNRR